MDHTEAVRLQAAAKYLLGELPKEQHAAYEEHYFDCSACADEIKATVAFVESGRQVAREKIFETIGDQGLVANRPVTGGWFAWLRPAFAVPVFASLLLFIGYQNGVTIPALRGLSAAPSAEIITAPTHLTGSVRGSNDTGEVANKVPAAAGESFLLKFDFTPSRTFARYQWQLQDAAGRAVRRGSIGGDKNYQEVYLTVNGGVRSPGKYTLVFFGDSGSSSATQNEVQRLTFAVEFQR